MDPDIIGLFCCLEAYQQTEGSVYCRTREDDIPVVLLGRTLIHTTAVGSGKVEGRGQRRGRLIEGINNDNIPHAHPTRLSATIRRSSSTSPYP